MRISRHTVQRVLSIAAALAFLIALAPPATDAAPPRDGQIVYVVNYGDTLFSIARRFGSSVSAIQAANSLRSDFIYVGQRLVIPVGSSSSILGPQPLPAITRTPFPPGTTACKYSVQLRDTLFSIAYRYRVTVSDLQQSNFLPSSYLRVGQLLNVPCATPTPATFQTYTVVAGDNLFRLAVRNSTSIYALALVNGIANPHLIFAGQTIVIPYPGSVIYRDIPGPLPNHVVISKFRTRGPNGGNDEFIELFNPWTSAFDISGWLIKGSSNTGVAETRATIPAGILLQSGKRYLLANNNSDGGYSAGVAADLTYTTGIADEGGIALTKADGAIVDAVGMSASAAFKEGTPLAPQAANEDRAYARKIGGCADANNNAADFESVSPSNPQNATSAVTLCATTPTLTPAGPTATTGPTLTPTPGTPTPTSAAVVMQNIAFLSANLTLTRGSTITWTNIDTVAHTVTNGTPGQIGTVFRSNQLNPGQTFSFIFASPGQFPYFCEIHGAAMTGQITIQ